jgi:8-oxo-dGTP diphosphatase
MRQPPLSSSAARSQPGLPMDDPLDRNANTLPHVLVSIVPMRIGDSGLEAALTCTDDGSPALIKGRPKAGELLDASAGRIVRESLGRDGNYLEQLYTFNRPANESGVVVGYMALFRANRDSPEGAGIQWVDVRNVRPADHLDRLVLDYAPTRLRAKLGYTNIAFHLLPETFTLTQVQQAFERVLGHPVDKRNFRRRMTATGVLVPLDRQRREGSHRPAALYRFAAQDDHAAYLTPSWASQRDTDDDAELTDTHRP